MVITDKDWIPEHSYGITRKRAIELGEDAEYPRVSAAVFHFDKLTPEEQATVIRHKEKELVEALDDRKRIYADAKKSARISRDLHVDPRSMNPFPDKKKRVKERIEMLQKSVDRLTGSAKVFKPANDTTSGLAVKKVKGGYEIVHTKSGNRLMPFAYPERELAMDFARRAGQVGVDWTRPFPELQKESEKIADLIRGGKKPGMFETAVGMPTTFPKSKSLTKASKEPWQMTIAELKPLVDKGSVEQWQVTLGQIEAYARRKIPGVPVSEGAIKATLLRHKQSVEKAISEGKSVPAEVLKDYPDLKGKVKTTDLQVIEDSRSPRSRESDERQSNADTIEPDDSRVEQWLKDQGRMDVSGIDTPRKGKGKKISRRVRKSTRTETQVRGIRK